MPFVNALMSVLLCLTPLAATDIDQVTIMDPTCRVWDCPAPMPKWLCDLFKH
ncbi:hypothetical protein BCUN_1845 [Bifidobacterium cuniculi]|uniref:Uncharacterized protein n=1 Tax=Bifidobacterium cuniculi TaxID=1688 RepID=A0A087AT40_9BIFI|nr:hypothetical protein BCUN_1845 [Bifidobacterium cuniculi]